MACGAQASPPDDVPADVGRIPEQPDDPYVPGVGTDGPVPRAPSNAPPGSVQVNVSSPGMNILGDAANEPSIAIDPTNPQRMAIGWRQFDTIASNFRQAGYGYSVDGGNTWTFPGVLEAGVFRSDPVLDADSSGRFFYASQRQNFCMDIYQSTNGGMSWPVSSPASGGDKAWLAVDRSGGIGDGNGYQLWQSAFTCSGIAGIFNRSTDHGVTWSTPIGIQWNPRLGVVAVGPDGAVYATGVTTSTSTFVVAKSSNAQDSSVTPTWNFSVMGGFLGGALVNSSAVNPGGLGGQVWIAVNPTNPMHVFLLCSVDPTGADPMDVRFARSFDGGQTWQASVRVNDDPVTNHANNWFGTMSVARNGRIDVIWNDTRDDPNNLLSRVYYAYSTNEGATWSANVALTPQWSSLVGWPNQNKIGDYYHMISTDTAAHLAYSATFNGEQDVYYMRIVQCLSCRGDVSGDGLKDGRDIANFVRCLNASPVPLDCGCADLNGDRLVNLTDLSLFVDNILFGGSCP